MPLISQKKLSIFRAELWEVLKGMKLPRKLGLNNPVVKCDSLTGLLTLAGKRMQNTQQLSSSRKWNKEFKFDHAWTEPNQYANWLASYSPSFKPGASKFP